MIHLAATGLLILAFIQAVTFVLRYLFTDWFKTSMGWHAMSFMAACGLALFLGLVREFAPDWIDLDTSRVVAFAVINVVFFWRNWLLFSGQRRARARREHTDHVS
jgi:hypothetical protein